MKSLAETHRRALRGLSLDQYGYVTPTNAEALGVPAIELRKIAQRGGLVHVAYGLYRFADIPITEFDTFMEAVLRCGPDAHLTATQSSRSTDSRSSTHDGSASVRHTESVGHSPTRSR